MLDGAFYQPGSIYRMPERPEREKMKRLADIGVAGVSAATAGPLARQRLIDAHSIPRIVGNGAIAGPAVTVWNPPGSVRMNIAAIETATAGDVIVISADKDTAQWGEIASTIAKGRGLAGAIVDGVVRDVDRIRELSFPTWGARIFASQGFRKEAGLVNAPVCVKGLIVRAGDIVVADGDGIFSFPSALLDAVLEKAEKKFEQEEIILQAVADGEIPPQMRVPFEISPVMGDAFAGELRHEDFAAAEIETAVSIKDAPAREHGNH